jgi:threonine/homoserine/homoserine lactone efflux protein
MFGLLMLYALLYGFGTGIVLSSMLGTVFFSLIQTSIDYGVRTTMYISVGVSVSDILLIVLTYFNATLIPDSGSTEMIVRVIGALVLIGMGTGNLVRSTKVTFPVTSASGKWMMAGKGFMLNFFNPGNFISWLSVSVLLIEVLKFSIGERIIFYTGAIIAIFLAELTIAYSAHYLRRFITNQFLHWLNISLGLVFCGFGIALIWPLLKKLGD